MTATTIRVQMAQRKDTAANWTAANPILLSGEIGYETDTKKFKIGNGSTNWNSLAYLPIPDGSGNLTITGNLEIGSTGSLTFEGSTADGFETTLAVTNPTADRTITLPNQSGTVLVSGNASIVDADIAINAEIAVSKLADGIARQLLQTDAAGTGVEWTSNIDVPGTLDVTSTATFDSIAQYPIGSAGAPTITFTGDPNTGIYSPGADQVAISTGGSGRLFVNSIGDIGVGTASPVNYQTFGYGPTIETQGGRGGSFVISNAGATIRGVFTADANAPNVILKTVTAHPLVLATDDTERLRITSAGLVGIGTSSPSAQLDVTGSTAGSGLLRVSNGTQTGWFGATATGFGFWSTGINPYPALAIGTTSNHPIVFGTNDVGRVVLDTSGNVGIGTTSPAATLHLESSAGTQLRIKAGSTNDAQIDLIPGGQTNPFYIYCNSSRNLIFQDNATERLRIDSSGRLLVGTSTARSNFFNVTNITPGVQIEQTGNSGAVSIIRQSADPGGPFIALSKSRGTTVGSNTLPANGDDLGAVAFLGSDGSEFVAGAIIVAQVDGTPGVDDMPTRLVFSTTADGASSPTERMRIRSTGAISMSSGLVIGGTGDPGSSFYITSDVITSGAGNSTLKYNSTSGLVTYDTSSRLVKENIEECPYGIDDLKQLKPRKYLRIDDQRTEIGFIADEVIDLMPEFVPVGAKSIITKNASDTELIPLGVNYEKLTAVLTKALQEAIAKIETLEAKVAALESA